MKLPKQNTHHEKNYRVMGMTHDDQEFLFAMGVTQEECLQAFRESVLSYSHSELRTVDFAWMESWTYDAFKHRFLWKSIADVPLKRTRLRAAAIHQHSVRRGDG
jgi:hypothetical protein